MVEQKSVSMNYTPGELHVRVDSEGWIPVGKAEHIEVHDPQPRIIESAISTGAFLEFVVLENPPFLTMHRPLIRAHDFETLASANKRLRKCKSC